MMNLLKSFLTIIITLLIVKRLGTPLTLGYHVKVCMILVQFLENLFFLIVILFFSSFFCSFSSAYCVLYSHSHLLEIFLKDLLYHDESYPNYTEDGLVDYSKLRIMGNIINDFRKCQITKYNLDQFKGM